MRAYPVKSLYEEMAFIAHHFHWSHSDLNAKGNEVLIELLELANEGIERVA